MKVSAFAQVAYRTFPADFERHHDSAVDTPWGLVDPREVRAAFRDYLDGLMLAARSGFDGVVFTEHAQSSYDMSANPSLTAAALAYATESEGLDVAIYPAGRSLAKTREPMRVAEEYLAIDTVSGGRLVAGFPVGLPYDACLNNGIPPIELRPRFDENLELILRAWREDMPFAWNGTIHAATLGQHLAAARSNAHVRPSGSRASATRRRYNSRSTVTSASTTSAGSVSRPPDRAFSTGSGSWSTGRLPRNPYRLGPSLVVGWPETTRQAGVYSGLTSSISSTKDRARSARRIWRSRRHRPARAAGAHARSLGHGIADKLRTIGFDELVDMGSVIVGSPRTVLERLVELVRSGSVSATCTRCCSSARCRARWRWTTSGCLPQTSCRRSAASGMTNGWNITGGPSGWAESSRVHAGVPATGGAR